MEDDYGMEDLWDDAEEFELDQLAQEDYEDDDFDPTEDAASAGYDTREDFGYFGEAGLWD